MAKTITGAVIDIDYLNKNDESVIRLTVKGRDGKSYEVFDDKFKPYFYLVPSKELDQEFVEAVSTSENGRTIKSKSVTIVQKSVLGKNVSVYRVHVSNTSHVPKLSSAMGQYGTCYEYDIPFAKRYAIDKGIVPLTDYKMELSEKENILFLESVEEPQSETIPDLNVLCFDIEVYNPLGVPRASKDPIIMMSYLCKKGGETKQGVITYKKIDLPFVETVKDEKEMINSFVKRVEELDADIIVGYNSANFDVKYLLDRAKALKMGFNMSRFEGDTKIESHGLVDRVKVAGRVHVDMYTVIKFISIVGAAEGTAENVLRLNSKTLKNVYEAITNDKKFAVDKFDIFRLWDGNEEELKTIATYNLEDSDELCKVYDTFIPIMIELSKLTHDPLTDVCVSTAGQLVEFMLMRHSVSFNEIIPNKPSEAEMKERSLNPIEGAYVKTPEPGIYSNLVTFDFRGLYPSIIISHNIDPSSLCKDCMEYFESPDGTRFDKNRRSITPVILKMMIQQRAEVKKAYKKDQKNIFLRSRSSALKIVSNSVYGYLGYPRSRWYSRPCAASVTAYGRQYIKESMEAAEKFGLKAIYGDTDSVVALLEGKTKEDVFRFLKQFNDNLPESMELELEDFYKHGVFVGRKNERGEGAKKKYALISENGRIKIRGFELVRRDWSRIARDTQRQVLETILNEGDSQKAAAIVKDAIKKLKDGSVPLSELVISTQLRKGIDNYDIQAPEIDAARKAIQSGLKKKEDLEGAIIGYVVTRHGSSISEKATLEEFAKDYDPEYYINNQVLPATMKILKELDFDENELKGLGTQRKLM